MKKHQIGVEKSILDFNFEEINLATALIQNQIKTIDNFNMCIHKDDETFSRLLDMTNSNRELAFLSYFMSGLQIRNTVRQIIHWKFNSFENVPAFLNFTCNYGHFTRFLIQELPPQRVWVSDIYADVSKFQQEQFGVNEVSLVSRPEDYLSDAKYNCILVTSLFSHLSERTFAAWLQRLYGLLAPDGILIFSVHDEVALPPSLKMTETGICFMEYSDSKSLNTQEYGGSTWVTESFVRKALHQATGGKGIYHRIIKGLWHFQDLYLVVNSTNQNFSSLNITFDKQFGVINNSIMEQSFVSVK